ncbi:hypothetical protein CALVIDRAFT_18460 [Calocera viscosa TUFC12733]|uniref:Uncharacterized protein n=1 Tax=Calocera viscosa (strain TUFC12733) TaxID=1330018 RepID=A0A167SDU0_CALVF|nr:hypothetical protein CALVIDRAFT_18460 [Calocera viscosa TUFC12733]
MSLRDLGLDGLALQPRVAAILTKLVHECDELKKRKRQDKAQIHTLREEVERLASHASILQDSLRDVSDTLTETRAVHARQSTSLARKNAVLSQRVRNLESTVVDLQLERDGLTDAVERLIEEAEGSVLAAGSMQHLQYLHSNSYGQQLRPANLFAQPSEEYAASLISSLARRLDATQDALENLEEDSETSIAILEARIAERESQLYGALMPSEGTQAMPLPPRVEEVASLRRSLPPEASRISNGHVYVPESELEDEVRRIARKLEDIQTSASHITGGNLKSSIPVLDVMGENVLDGLRTEPANFPSESMDIPEPGNTLELDVVSPSAVDPAPSIRRSPKSPRLKSVLKDLDAEIDRLTLDLQDLKAEKETMLQISGDAMDNLGTSSAESMQIIGATTYASETDRDNPAVSGSQSPPPHHEPLPPDSSEDPSIASYDPTSYSDDAYSSTPIPNIQSNLAGPIDPMSLQQQLAEAQDALMAKEAQLRRLQEELEAMLIDDAG